MLVLTRKVGTSIQIGEDIKIVVTEVNDGTVKIGIVAPKNVDILRTEIIGTPSGAPKTDRRKVLSKVLKHA